MTAPSSGRRVLRAAGVPADAVPDVGERGDGDDPGGDGRGGQGGLQAEETEQGPVAGNTRPHGQVQKAPGDHRDDPGFTNPADIVTGEYPDGKAGDERFWAAAELARTTGKDVYRNAAAELLSSGNVSAELGWAEMGGYGLYAILTDPNLAEDDSGYMQAKTLFSDAVRRISSAVTVNSYGINRSDSFEWGSNMGIANDGVLLMMGAAVFDDETLRAEAGRQLDYLLGENATGYCFVTGYGEKSPVHPHHRPSAAFGAPMPGMLVGGPDSSLEDPFAQNVLAGCDPAKCYADSDQSYSTNEVCVYWNSPLILLISALTA